MGLGVCNGLYSTEEEPADAKGHLHWTEILARYIFLNKYRPPVKD